MGYKVRVLPKNEAEGWLRRGRKVQRENAGYFCHPSAARAAIAGYLARNPGTECQVLTWGDESLVESIK